MDRCEVFCEVVEAGRMVCESEEMDGPMVDRAKAIGDVNERTGMVARRRWLGAIVSWSSLQLWIEYGEIKR